MCELRFPVTILFYLITSNTALLISFRYAVDVLGFNSTSKMHSIQYLVDEWVEDIDLTKVRRTSEQHASTRTRILDLFSVSICF